MRSHITIGRLADLAIMSYCDKKQDIPQP